MLISLSKDFGQVTIPSFEGEIKMLPFSLAMLNAIPDMFKELVNQMIAKLPYKYGTAYLTIDGRLVEKNTSHRRGGPHIDGNYIPEMCGWGGSGTGGTQGWKVGEGGRALSTREHRLSYDHKAGGMLIASTHAACKGWHGVYPGKAGIGGDCSDIFCLDDGFILEANKLYYGTSQFIHESLPVTENVHRTLARITLPLNYPYLYE